MEVVSERRWWHHWDGGIAGKILSATMGDDNDEVARSSGGWCSRRRWELSSCGATMKRRPREEEEHE